MRVGGLGRYIQDRNPSQMVRLNKVSNSSNFQPFTTRSLKPAAVHRSPTNIECCKLCCQDIDSSFVHHNFHPAIFSILLLGNNGNHVNVLCSYPARGSPSLSTSGRQLEQSNDSWYMWRHEKSVPFGWNHQSTHRFLHHRHVNADAVEAEVADFEEDWYFGHVQYWGRVSFFVSRMHIPADSEFFF